MVKLKAFHQPTWAERLHSTPNQSLGHDVLMRSIKIVDIGYLTVIYVAFAIVCAKLTDRIFGKFDPSKESHKTMVHLSLELVIALWMYGVLIYLIRNIVPLFPFPLNGVGGFDHLKVKEVTNPTIFVFVFLAYSDHLRNKIKYYYERLSNGTQFR